MTKMTWFHLFCEAGAVRPLTECHCAIVSGEELARLTPERAEEIARLPECCRWAAVQPGSQFGCPEGHDFDGE